jgi:hypothetical protein
VVGSSNSADCVIADAVKKLVKSHEFGSLHTPMRMLGLIEEVDHVRQSLI